MTTTGYFRNDVLTKRPYLSESMCRTVIANAVRKVVQPDGRIRYWAFDVTLHKWLRVVTLKDGVTIHNAFPDRNFTP